MRLESLMFVAAQLHTSHSAGRYSMRWCANKMIPNDVIVQTLSSVSCKMCETVEHRARMHMAPTMQNFEIRCIVIIHAVNFSISLTSYWLYTVRCTVCMAPSHMNYVNPQSIPRGHVHAYRVTGKWPNSEMKFPFNVIAINAIFNCLTLMHQI